MFATRQGSRSGTPRRSMSRSRAGSVVSPPRSKPAPAVQQNTDSNPAPSTLVSDAHHRVLVSGTLPLEVQHVVEASAGDTLLWALDHASYARLTTKAFCYCWHTSRRISAPQVYRFVCPPSSTDDIATAVYAPLPLSAFVDYGPQREPGLLLVSSTNGHIKVWDSLASSLTGQDRHVAATLGLEKGEIARHILSLGPNRFLLSTSSSRLIKVAIAFTAGRPSVSVVPLARPRGVLSRIGSTFFFGAGSIPLTSHLGYTAITSAPDSKGNPTRVWALKSKSIEAWNVPLDGSPDQLVDQWEGMEPSIRDHILSLDLEGLEAYNLDLKLEDAKATSGDGLILLFSHAAPATQSKSRSYALAMVSISSNEITLEHFIRLAYNADPDLRTLSPYLLTVEPAVVFIAFAEAIVVWTPQFEEVVALKPGSQNRFIGSAIVDATAVQAATFHSGILRIDAFLTPAGEEELTPAEAKTAKLTSKLERAVFFSDKAENPLSFELGITGEGDIAVAAETVSEDILTSSSNYLPSILDLRAHLAERSARLKTLIILLNENDLVPKLSQSTRRQLAWDADRLAAASGMWHLFNHRSSDDHHALLQRAIGSFMADFGHGYQEDPVRAYFKTKLLYLGTLLEEIDKQLKTALNGLTRGESRGVLLLEASQIWLAAYQAIARQRETAVTLYRIDLHTLTTEAWTSRPVLIEAMQFLFEANYQTVVEAARDRGVPPAQDTNDSVIVELKTSMTELAEYLLGMYEERLLFLHGSPSAGLEERNVQERYFDARPRLIRMLVNIGRANHAYSLAERHADFKTLVELCQDPVHGSSAKTAHFIEKYKETFAFALYDWLIEKGQLKTLLSQDAAHAGFLKRYFDQTGNARVSWIHSIALDRVAEASSEAFTEAAKASVLAERKVMLSISKLSKFAQRTTAEEVDPVLDGEIGVINEKLDIVNAQSILLQAFEKKLTTANQRQPIETRIQSLATALAPSLTSQKAFQQLFRNLVLSMLNGNALSVEDLVDAYTLQETTRDPFRDQIGHEEDTDFQASLQHWNFPPALAILQRTQDLPTARMGLALGSIWRRIYLRDDWRIIHQSSNYTDAELADIIRATALYQTLRNAKVTSLPDSLLLAPSEALLTASPEDVKARFFDASAHEIQSLLGDYQSGSLPCSVCLALNPRAAESNQLQSLIDGAQLTQYYQEARRLLEAALEEETDVQMQL